jgi:hypothetical protein
VPMWSVELAHRQVRSTSDTGHKAEPKRPRLSAKSRPEQVQQKLFDHLVGSGEQAWRKAEAECPGGVEVDHELEFDRLHDR